MTYDLHLFKPQLGIDPLVIAKVLVSGDLNMLGSTISQLEIIDWHIEKAVASALLQKNPHLKILENPQRSIELHDRNDDTGIGDTGIEVVLYGNGIRVYIPYWHRGVNAKAVLGEVWSYLEIMQRSTGCLTFDAQLKQILDLAVDLDKVVASYENAITQFQSEAEEWITHNDDAHRLERLARLNWLLGKESDWGIVMFPGGPMSRRLYFEARNSFIYGQFLATIVLGLSCAEHTLAGLFQTSDRYDLKRAGILILLKEARKCDWIDQADFNNLQHAREIRNLITHFRRLSEIHSLPYTINEEDARHVMEAVWRLLDQFAA
jgi:hypothetical protein